MFPPSASPDQVIDQTLRAAWGRILAALVKHLGDLQLAEDALQDALVAATADWRANGLPRSPDGWLIAAARRKAIDRIRRDQRQARWARELSHVAPDHTDPVDIGDMTAIPDKRLEMIFTCCHPSLAEKTQVALTLRTLGGLSTENIARAFLDKPEAMAQRLTRARQKIRAARIPYIIPDRSVLPERLAAVLGVIYLIFNAGYAAPQGPDLIRADLTDEALRLGRTMHGLLPDQTEVAGLLALMLLHDARRATRTDPAGNMIPLEAQNRARWDRGKIAEGARLLEVTLPKGEVGPYQIQAAISALHVQSPTWADTDWAQIVDLYGLLFRIQPTPVVRINQAIALSYAQSVPAALTMLDDAAAGRALEHYQPFHAARADLLARDGQAGAARAAYARAIALSENAAEVAFLTARQSALCSAPQNPDATDHPKPNQLE